MLPDHKIMPKKTVLKLQQKELKNKNFDQMLMKL
jgi:hypothetical protein